jgi:hypothetical protein
MNRRTEIMDEPRKRQLGRAEAAANGCIGFYEQHAQAFLRQANGGGQSIWTGPNDNRII